MRFPMNRRVRGEGGIDRYRDRRTMSTYIVTYDLSAPGRDYKRLIDYLKTHSYAHVVESSWVIKTFKSADTLRDEIARYVDSNDKVLVIKTTRSAAWIGLQAAVGNWLKEHLEYAA
jgi:hypothetical protein